MANNREELAGKVIELIGGKKNITEAWHCVTRLRFNVNETKTVKIDDIKKVKGVIGVQFSGEQFQVIIGNDVSNVFTEVEKQLGTLSGEASSQKSGGNVIGKLMDTISGIFTPALPALVGTGLLKGLLALFLAVGWLQVEDSGYIILNMIADCAFYFLPFILAVSSARKFKTNEYLALCIAGVLLYPTMTAGSAAMMAGEALPLLKLFGVLPVPYLTYSSSVIPIILATYFLKHVYNLVKKYMPVVVSTMFTPMLTLLIVIPVTLVVLGPIGTYAGAILANGILWLFNHAGILAGAIVGGLYPVLVMTGMHWALMPIMVNSFAELGFDNSMMPAMLVATFAMAGATFGVFFKTKNSEMKQNSLSSGISAILGITEPAMYGVVLKLKKTFYAAITGGAISGAFLNVLGVKCFGMSMPGLIALPGYADVNDSSNLIKAVIGSALAFGIALAITYIVGFKEESDTESDSKASTESGKQLPIYAATTGKIIPVETVPDATFSEQIMGYTTAVKSNTGKIVAPIAGEVMMIASTKHAIGIKGTDGLEVLIHLGIDTVELNGEPFNVKVAVGDTLTVGQEIAEMDIKQIEENGLDPVVLSIVTNSSDYLKILTTFETDVISEGNQLSMALT